MDKALTPKATSGRMFAPISSGTKKLDRLSTGFGPGVIWIADMEFENLEPGQVTKFDLDQKAYPREFSQAPAGDYQSMALLDQNQCYAQANQHKGQTFDRPTR